MKLRFRCWDKTNKKMIDEIGVDIVGRPIDGWNEYFSKNGKEIDFEIMQFTGLLDKNGKMIFEGDIFTEGQERMDSFGTINFVIKWHKKFGQWGFSRPNHSDRKLKGIQPFYYNGSFFDSSRFEVIGNVYENSELLK